MGAMPSHIWADLQSPGAKNYSSISHSTVEGLEPGTAQP